MTGRARPPLSHQRTFLLALAGLTLLRLVVAALVPVSPDEAYYWVWSRALAPGYLDHPPMVALWTRIGTWLCGDSGLGIRLLAPFAVALGSLMLKDAAKLLGAGEGYAAAALLNATLLYGAGGTLMTPDTPLLFFWIATLWAMARLVAGGSGWWWIGVGVAAGLALVSKYTGALLPVGIGLWLLLTPTGRRWLRDPRPWLGLGLTVLLFLPVILWNAAHGWASFLKQGGRTGAWHAGRSLQFLGELLAGQIGLATPIIFVLCMIGLWTVARRSLREGAPGPALLAALGVLPALLFLEHALGDRVQGNWPEILYPAAAIAAAGLPLTRRWLRPALGLGFALTLIVYLQAIASPIPIGGVSDPTIRVLGGWQTLADQVRDRAKATGARFVAVDEYGLASELALRLPRDLPVLAEDPRWLLFRLPRATLAPGTPGLFLRTERRRTPPDAAPWANLTQTGHLDRGRHGRIGESYTVYDATAGEAAARLLTLLPSGDTP